MMESDIDVPQELMLASEEGQWIAVRLVETLDSASCRVTDDDDDCEDPVAFSVHAGNLYTLDAGLVGKKHGLKVEDADEEPGGKFGGEVFYECWNMFRQSLKSFQS